MHMTGQARDLLTPGAGAPPVVLAEDGFVAVVSPQREIVSIDTLPARPAAVELIGARAGSQLRSAIEKSLGDELVRGTPLYLLLDDIAGASLVANWGTSQWSAQSPLSAEDPAQTDRLTARMMGVCMGFSPESWVYTRGPEGRASHHRTVPALDAGTDDAFAWHALPAQQGPAARRARRIDVWFEDGVICADTHFQDSAPLPDGTRLAVHEYLVNVKIDPGSMTVSRAAADPRILPFSYCPAASLGIDRLVGLSVGSLRKTVIERFARTQGCTHLNDTMRSLAEVAQLIAALQAAMP
ncbi:MAG TPA: DUF2889 domain-containing protein [Novosphingobium sp.]